MTIEQETAEPPAKIKLSGVNRTFTGGGRGGSLVALQDIGLEVGEGEFVCFLGQSGCGKSTLLRIVAGLDREFTGEAELNGKPLAEPGRDRTMLFQDHGLFPWLDVLGNVLFPLKHKPGLTDKERREVAH